MVHGTHGRYHLEKRKRMRLKREKYPHPNKWKNLVDKLVYVAGVISLIMTLPQVTIIWINQDVSGVSILSWLSYLFVGIVWLTYGILHKEKSIIVTYALWIVMEVFIIVGIVLYS
ncbi:hypothetical protein ACFLQN_04375 [Candidatus Aenigmatarchaeota archaeon]